MPDQAHTAGFPFQLPGLDGEPLVSYEAVELPIAMERLVAGRPGAVSADDLQPYVKWVQARWRERARYGIVVFRNAGFKPPENQVDAVVEFERWLLSWIPLVYRDAGGWTTDLFGDGAATILPPGSDGFDPQMYRLTASLTHDIAFTLITYLPAEDVTWAIHTEQVRQPEGLVGRLYAGIEGFQGKPIGESYSTLLGALSRPGSLSDTVLKERRASGWCRLCELYDALRTPL